MLCLCKVQVPQCAREDRVGARRSCCWSLPQVLRTYKRSNCIIINTYTDTHIHTHMHACATTAGETLSRALSGHWLQCNPSPVRLLTPTQHTLCARSWHRKKVKCCNIGSTNQLPSATMCASKSAFCSAKNAPTPRKPARTSTTSTRGNANYADPNLCQVRIAQLSYTCRKTCVFCC